MEQVKWRKFTGLVPDIQDSRYPDRAYVVIAAECLLNNLQYRCYSNLFKLHSRRRYGS